MWSRGPCTHLRHSILRITHEQNSGIPYLYLENHPLCLEPINRVCRELCCLVAKQEKHSAEKILWEAAFLQ